MNQYMYSFRWLLCLLISLGGPWQNVVLHAQEKIVTLDTFSREKIPILVEPMKFPADLPPALTQRIQQVAYTALERHWHFQVINHSSGENRGEVDPEYIFQLSLQPLIDNLTQNDLHDSSGVTSRTDYYLSGGIKLNLRVTDIVTGELKYSRDVESIKSARARKYFTSRKMVFAYGVNPNWHISTKSYPFPTSPKMEAQILQEEKNKLLLQALDHFPVVWQHVLAGIFPAPIHLVDIVTGTPKKPKRVQIDAGEDFGIRSGYPLEAYTYKSYNALGEQFLREEVLGIFYPVEIGTHSTVGRIYGGRKEIGQVLARGDTVFFRFKDVWWLNNN